MKLTGIEQIANVAFRIADEKAMGKAIMDNMPKAIQQLSKADDFLSSEVSNIAINAAGTGIVAPTFIKHNPLAKTDKETKEYSALRQPVSAVLAVLTQIGAIIPLDKRLNWAANEGKLGVNYDKSNLQDLSYIAKQVKKANPNMAKDALAKEVDNIHLKQVQNAMAKLMENGAKGDLYEQVQKNAKLMAKNIKWLKAITGLGIGVAMVPLTCTLLNMIYPKFVEKFYPHLCKDKPESEAKKCAS